MADRRDNNDISREEKLNLINQELILLHHQAKQSKNMNVFKAESNFLAENKIHSKKMQYISFIAKFSIFIGIISCLIYCDPLVRYVRASSRKLTIKVSNSCQSISGETYIFFLKLYKMEIYRDKYRKCLQLQPVSLDSES